MTLGFMTLGFMTLGHELAPVEIHDPTRDLMRPFGLSRHSLDPVKEAWRM